MAPTTLAVAGIIDSADNPLEDKDDWSFTDYWNAVCDWLMKFFHGVNNESEFNVCDDSLGNGIYDTQYFHGNSG